MPRTILITLILTIAIAFSAVAREPHVYVVNTSGETLSKINLTSGVVTNHIVALGSTVLSYPSQILVRDTLAFVLNSGTDEIQIIDLISETTSGFIDLPEGSSPFLMAFYNDQYVYVSTFVDGNLIKVDVPSGNVESVTPVGVSPEDVCITSNKIYVAITAFDQQTWQYGQGQVAVIDPTADTLLGHIDVGTNPQYLEVDSQGRLHVVCTGNYWSVFGTIYVIDTGTDLVVDSMVTGGFPGELTIAPNNIAHIAAGGWVDDGQLFTYNALTLDLYHGSVNPIVVDSGCMIVQAYQDSSVFVGAFKDFVTAIDTSGAESARYAVGDGPISIDFNYLPGDIDGDFQISISDLIYMVDYMFSGGPAAPYPSWRINTNGSLGLDISDLVYLVTYMFSQGPPPVVGPTWLVF